MAAENSRSKPNVLITGTPGTGKSVTATEVAHKTGAHQVNIGDVAKVNNFYLEWDQQFQCHVLDEDKVSNTVVLNLGSTYRTVHNSRCYNQTKGRGGLGTRLVNTFLIIN